jgi:hypothetical protein
MSTEDGLSQPKLFVGTLSQEGKSVAVAARIHVDASGEILFDFDRVPYTPDSGFLLQAFYNNDSRPITFTLVGVAVDQTRFQTDNFHLDKCSPQSSDADTWLDIAGSCASGVFNVTRGTSTPLPILQMHLRGFQLFTEHAVASTVGTVSIGRRQQES